MTLDNIKIFITDIDGVWTDGGMYYDQTGNEWKKFNTSDSAGVLFLRLLNIPTAIITGENTLIVRNRAEKLKIPYLYMGCKNKLKTAEELSQNTGIPIQNMAYIGDDINDIQLIEKVGLSAAPLQAPDYIKQRVDWVLGKKGGEGAFRAFVEEYLNKTDQLDKVISMYFNTERGG